MRRRVGTVAGESRAQGERAGPAPVVDAEDLGNGTSVTEARAPRLPFQPPPAAAGRVASAPYGGEQAGTEHLVDPVVSAPVGDAGPMGDAGQIGDTGPAGHTGPAGDTGHTGPAGDTGHTGRHVRIGKPDRRARRAQRDREAARDRRAGVDGDARGPDARPGGTVGAASHGGARRSRAHGVERIRLHRRPSAPRTAPAHRSKTALEVAGWVVALRRAPTSLVLMVLVGALCVLGVVMVGSASTAVSLSIYGTPWAILLREGLWMGIGLVAFALTCRFDYRRWRRLSPFILIVTFVLLLMVLVPGLGVRALGSSRWIGFGQFRLQPSELMKLALALFGADLLVRRAERGGSYRMMTGPLLLLSGAAAALIIVQPDMGTALVVGAIALGLLFASGVPLRPVAKVLGALMILALMVAVFSPYRRARILSFLDPSAHSAGSGYQVVQSLIGLGSGHLFGLGLGSGRLKWGYLPNAHTDFIFSVIGEELGLVGAVAVLVMLTALAWFGLRAAGRAPDRFGSLLGVALVVWIIAETVINVGAVIGLLPVTGIPLPFISFGGSSLVITLVAAGILVNIARQERSHGEGPDRSRSAAPGRRSDLVGAARS